MDGIEVLALVRIGGRDQVVVGAGELPGGIPVVIVQDADPAGPGGRDGQEQRN